MLDRIWSFYRQSAEEFVSEVGWFPFKIWWQFEAAIPDHTLPDPGEERVGGIGIGSSFEGLSRERLSALVV